MGHVRKLTHLTTTGDTDVFATTDIVGDAWRVVRNIAPRTRHAVAPHVTPVTFRAAGAARAYVGPARKRSGVVPVQRLNAR